jgi:hypothetical protein
MEFGGYGWYEGVNVIHIMVVEKNTSSCGAWLEFGM